jgi:hypothetical protein
MEENFRAIINQQGFPRSHDGAFLPSVSFVFLAVSQREHDEGSGAR